MEPIVTPQDAKPRGPTSSAEYNQLNEDILCDLLRLYESSDLNKSQLEKLVNMLIHENIFIQRKMEALELRVSDLVKLLNTGSKTAVMSPTQMVTSHPLYLAELPALSIDNEYRQATLGKTTETISRTHLINSINGEIVIPNEIGISVYPTVDHKTITDNDLIGAFHPNSERYFERRIKRLGSDSTTEEECLIVIDLPSNIASTLNANNILFKPFPENSLDIMGVYYNKEAKLKSVKMWTTPAERDVFHSTMINNGWLLMPGFPVDQNSEPNPIIEAERVKWSFSNTPMTQIAIRLRQRNWIESGTDKIFIIGVHEIDVRLDNYSRTGGFALMEFKPIMSAGHGTFVISDIVPHFLNNDALSSLGAFNPNAPSNNCVRSEVYIEQGGSFVKLAKGGSGYPTILGDTCWIAMYLYPDPVYKCTPVLDSIEIKYVTS